MLNRKLMLGSVLAAMVISPVAAVAADDPILKAQQLRQAPMKLIANNFGYMRAMNQGKVPQNDAAFMARGKELAALGQLDLMRGYIEDSYEGKTRAKPDVDLDFEDFTGKMRDFEKSLQAMGSATDVAGMKAAHKELGESCKSCHKKYKSKNYQD